MMEFQDGDRVIHEHYGEGVITGHWKHTYEPEMLWHVRFDNPGIDDDILPTSKLKLVRPQITQVFFFTNGNVAVCNDKGEQVPTFQGSWVNFDYLKRLAKVIAQDSPKVQGLMRLPDPVGSSFSTYYSVETKRLGEEKCTCNDYPHHELCGAVQDYPDSEGKK
jgi:hypothetical protein